MLAQTTVNLSNLSLPISLLALAIALFSLPATIKQYVVWARDAVLWLVLAFVAAVGFKVVHQRATREGKPMTQVVAEMVGLKSSDLSDLKEAAGEFADSLPQMNAEEK